MSNCARMQAQMQIQVFFHLLNWSIPASILLSMQLKIGLELIIMELLNSATKNASGIDSNTSSICDVIMEVNINLELQWNKNIIFRNGQAHEKLNALFLSQLLSHLTNGGLGFEIQSIITGLLLVILLIQFIVIR